MDSVLAILENKTIRFTRLDSLNDLNEGCCGEYAHLKKYVYISSWSADERESIPMWSLYGKKDNILDEGVRIKVPTNLFTFDEKENLANKMVLEQKFGGWNITNDVKTKDIALSDEVLSKMPNVNLNDPHFTTKKVIGPVKVNYIPFSDYAKKYSTFLKPGQHAGFYSFHPNEIGYEKVADWSYENEYRFWLQYPHCEQIYGSGGVLKNDISFTKETYIDVLYNDKAIPEMEIMLAPNFAFDKKESFREKLNKIGFTKGWQESRIKVKF